LPKRPLDGIDLSLSIKGQMLQRPQPIGFWSFDINGESKNQPYIEADLQRGTTPLVKLMGDISTRNFRNFHHPKISQQDYSGSRALIDNRYKFIIRGKRGMPSQKELFDLRADPGEKNNLMTSKPKIATTMQKQLRDWQESVLESLSGADYR